MIIVYIHGFCSSSKAIKAQILDRIISEEYKEISFVSAEFSDSFSVGMKQLENLIESLCGKDRNVCIVGSSLGGFYALSLSIRYSLKAALVNPCLNPSYFLKRYDYLGKELENFDTGNKFIISQSDILLMEKLEKEQVDYDSSLISVFLQKGDEVLDYRVACEFFSKYGAQTLEVQEGGSHRYDNFEETVGRIIAEFKKDGI